MRKLFNLLLAVLFFTSCSKSSVTITWNDGKVVTTQVKGDRTFLVEIDKGANVTLECNLPPGECPVIRLRGKSKGSFTYKAEHTSTIILDGLNLSAKAGKTPLNIKNKRTTTLHLLRGTANKLHDGAQPDNSTSAKDCMRCKGDLVITGDGELQLKATHTGSKGMKCYADFEMRSGRLKITTTGNYLREITVRKPPRNIGQRPPVPVVTMANGDSVAPPPPPPTLSSPMFEQKYRGTCKGAKIMGTALIAGGELKVSTSSPGAEGFEAKSGITITGGKIHIEAYDDGLNSNGPILITGGEIYALSTHNDGLDTNYGKEGCYTQTDGRVELISLAGPPEESLDTDWTPITHVGGDLIVKPDLQKEPFFNFQP